MTIRKVLVQFALINLLLGGIHTAAENNRDAEGEGGYLVVINSKEEQQFLGKLMCNLECS